MGKTMERNSAGAKPARAKGAQKRNGEKLCENMTFAAREAFKRLRTNLQMGLSGEEKKCQVIGITSAQPSEGKSTVSINLAYSLAELGKSVLLIDGDMRRPSLHTKLGIRQSPGLSDLLTDEDNVGQAVARYKCGEEKTAFDVITSGGIPTNPSELLNSKRFGTLIQVLSSACDYIIIDLPPIDAVVDAVNASKVTDGMIVVLRENNCPRTMLMDCMEQLTYAKANILGFVVNGSLEGASKSYQYAYR